MKDERKYQHKNEENSVKQEIYNHILSFPNYVSHYKRETSSALYLDPSLNLRKMFELYVSEWKFKHQAEEKHPSFNCYKKFFETTNFKFKALKSDTCKSCDVFKIKIQTSKTRGEISMVIVFLINKSVILKYNRFFSFELDCVATDVVTNTFKGRRLKCQRVSDKFNPCIEKSKEKNFLP